MHHAIGTIVQPHPHLSQHVILQLHCLRLFVAGWHRGNPRRKGQQRGDIHNRGAERVIPFVRIRIEHVNGQQEVVPVHHPTTPGLYDGQGEEERLVPMRAGRVGDHLCLQCHGSELQLTIWVATTAEIHGRQLSRLDDIHRHAPKGCRHGCPRNERGPKPHQRSVIDVCTTAAVLCTLNCKSGPKSIYFATLATCPLSGATIVCSC